MSLNVNDPSLVGLGVFPPPRGEQPRGHQGELLPLQWPVLWWNRRDSIAREMPQRLEALGLTQARVTHLNIPFPMEAVESSCG